MKSMLTFYYTCKGLRVWGGHVSFISFNIRNHHEFLQDLTIPKIFSIISKQEYSLNACQWIWGDSTHCAECTFFSSFFPMQPLTGYLPGLSWGSFFALAEVFPQHNTATTMCHARDRVFREMCIVRLHSAQTKKFKFELIWSFAFQFRCRLCFGLCRNVHEKVSGWNVTKCQRK